MTTVVELCTLPVEIQNLIVLSLHPSAAMALRQTNRWFHTHVSLHRLNKKVVQKYLHKLELQLGKENYYACFSCLCLKPQTAFTGVQVAKSPRYMTFTFNRFCLECGVRSGEYKPGHSLRMVAPESKPAVFCGFCMSVQTNFCSKCYCCIACITSMGVWTGRAKHWSQRGGDGLCPTHLKP